MNEIFVDKLIITQCVIFGIMTSIIISNKWHVAKSFFERVVGVILGSVGFIFTYGHIHGDPVEVYQFSIGNILKVIRY